MNEKSAVADDPQLQDKGDGLVKKPDLYFLEMERFKVEETIECNKRMLRALEKEIHRGEQVVSALSMAIKTLMYGD